MERKIGETFDFAGVTIEVVEYDGCKSYRSDDKSVIFKEVDRTLELLVKAHAELVRCGIESEIVDEIQEYLNTTKQL